MMLTRTHPGLTNTPVPVILSYLLRFSPGGFCRRAGGLKKSIPHQRFGFQLQRALIETVALALSVSLSHGSFSLDKAVE